MLSDFSDAGSIPIYNPWGGEADLESLMARPLTWDLRGERPTVLILHTHSTESYAESPQWRTLDEDANMLSIGKQVAEILESEGIPVIQDRTLHDHPSYNGSYGDARKSIQAILKDNPDIRLVLDLHRDASEGKNGQMRPLVNVDGEDIAQLMLVMGCNHETFAENLSLALKLHAQLEYQAPGIMRPMQLRTARYNQDLSPGALLVEVGAAGNTHREAIAAAEQLAFAIIALARGTG